MTKYDVSPFKGVNVAFCSPYDSKGRVDTDAAKANARWYAELGVSGLYVCGSSGECVLLSEEERKRIAEAVVAEVGKEIPVIIHVGSPSTGRSLPSGGARRKRSARRLRRRYPLSISI